jgi:hypothetical protein
MIFSIHCSSDLRGLGLGSGLDTGLLMPGIKNLKG